MDYDRDKAKANATMPTVDVVAALKASLPDVWQRAEVVGRWVWVKFEVRPADEIRKALLELGFYWNQRRQTWQHACGWFTKRSPGNPKNKYITMPAAALEEPAAA